MHVLQAEDDAVDCGVTCSLSVKDVARHPLASVTTASLAMASTARVTSHG